MKNNSFSLAQECIITFLHDTLDYFNAIKINVFVAIVAGLFFLSPTQSIDFFNGLINDSVDSYWSNIIFWASVTLLSSVMWYSSIHFLMRSDPSDLRSKACIQDFVDKWLPFFCGISVYVVVLCGFWQQRVLDNNIKWYYLLAGFFVIGALTYLRDVFFGKAGLLKAEEARDGIAKYYKEQSEKPFAFRSFLSKKDFPTWRFLSTPDAYIIIISFFLTMLLLLGALIMSSFFELKPVHIPQAFRASTLICLFLTGFIMFLLFWQCFLGNKLFRTIGFLTILLILVFSTRNNNHQFRIVKEANSASVGVEKDFSNWLKVSLDTTRFNHKEKFPIYLIAAEGGGIRSMKWTALVLDKLYSTIPNFKNHVYAVSGVSGGSVGAIFQQASLVTCPEMNCQNQLDKAVSGDFLSPLTFGLLFPDFIQAIWPRPIQEWDRSKWLEDAWQYAFDKEFESNILNHPLSTTLSTSKDRLPNIFLNSIALETGQKVIISNLKVPEKYFKNTIDLTAEVKKKNPDKGIPLKTAASLSARFPIVTSAGRLAIEDGIINVADGGYHDNTGLETILQLMHLMIGTADKDLIDKCQISVILIKNSITEDNTDFKSKDFLIDLNTPIRAFMNNWNDRTVSMIENFETAVTTFKELGITTNFFKIELDRNVFNNKEEKEVILPLGWYLSEFSSTEISKQSNLLTTPPEFGSEQGTVNKKNFDTLKSIRAQISN